MTSVTADRQPRRSERKSRTRQALIDAALDLMAEQGYDAVTTDDIAAVAGVSPRTFFRYFPTKESVLLFGEDDFIRSFAGVYLAQPAEVPEFDAIAASLVSLAPGVTRLHRRIRLYHKALGSSHILRGQQQRQLEENVVQVASAIARRRGQHRTDVSSRLLAGVSVRILNDALVDWAAGSPRVDLGQLLGERFALLPTLVAAAR